MGSLFTGYSAEELAFSGENVVFGKDEVVSATVLSVKMDEKYKNVSMLCSITDGEHKGKQSEIVVADKAEVPFLAGIARQFGKAFFTNEQLMRPAGIPCAELIGVSFQCRALEAREHNGRTYQTFTDYKKLGKEEIPF